MVMVIGDGIEFCHFPILDSPAVACSIHPSPPHHAGMVVSYHGIHFDVYYLY